MVNNALLQLCDPGDSVCLCFEGPELAVSANTAQL